MYYKYYKKYIGEMKIYEKLMLLLTIAFIFTIPLDVNTIIHEQSFAQISPSPERLPPTSTPPFEELPQQQKATSTNKTCIITPSLIEVEGTPQQIEGPYFVDSMPNRSDLRVEPSDGSIQEGIPLNITINAYRVDDSDGDGKETCVPFSGAIVDIWEANSQGLYSGVREDGTQGLDYLRGNQITNENGTVKFQTIYPGWYENRAIHIHLKVRDFEGPEKIFEWTSQLYLPNSINEQVHLQPPYNDHGPVPMTNEQDFIYTGPSTDGLIKNNTGNHLILNISKSDGGYSGTFNVELNATMDT
jgi:protocatechuate 3,4-dioxygenase beta subunit